MIVDPVKSIGTLGELSALSKEDSIQKLFTSIENLFLISPRSPELTQKFQKLHHQISQEDPEISILIAAFKNKALIKILLRDKSLADTFIQVAPFIADMEILDYILENSDATQRQEVQYLYDYRKTKAEDISDSVFSKGKLFPWEEKRARSLCESYLQQYPEDKHVLKMLTLLKRAEPGSSFTSVTVNDKNVIVARSSDCCHSDHSFNQNRSSSHFSFVNVSDKFASDCKELTRGIKRKPPQLSPTQHSLPSGSESRASQRRSQKFYMENPSQPSTPILPSAQPRATSWSLLRIAIPSQNVSASVSESSPVNESSKRTDHGLPEEYR